MQSQSRMKEALDTPAKSRPPIDDNVFASSNHPTQDNLVYTWVTACDVVKQADHQRSKSSPEAQWCSFVIAPILNLLNHTANDCQLEILDLSTTSIEPTTLCPFQEDPAISKYLNKRIDFGLGLKIPYEQRLALTNGAFQTSNSHNITTSINQTSTFVNYVPMFVSIEVKRKHVSEDPMIQLGAWVAADFRKRLLEGYDMGMPVFAIEIEEDRWSLYIVYATSSSPDHLVFIGPVPMGDSQSHQGVFKILHVLAGLAEWANTEYRPWFEREVLQRHRKE